MASEAWLSPIGVPAIDVLHPFWGAKGDGSTDDGPSINRAIANSGGGIVRIAGGRTYAVSSLAVDTPCCVDARGARFQHIGSGALLTIAAAGNGYEWTGGALFGGPQTTKVLDLGNSNTYGGSVSGFSISGGPALPAGIYFEDAGTGYTIADFVVAQCGNGIANANHAFSNLFRRGKIYSNTVGINWVKFGQNTKFDDVEISGNSQNQVLIGDGSQVVSGPITFNRGSIQSGVPTAAQSSVVTNNCDLLVFDEVYWETGAFAASCDLEIAGNPSFVVMRSTRANGNSQVDCSVKIDAGVTGAAVLMEAARSISYLMAVVNDGGTSSNVQKLGCLEMGTFVAAQLNGTNLAWP